MCEIKEFINADKIALEALRIVKHCARREETAEEALRQANAYLTTLDLPTVSEGDEAYDGLMECYEQTLKSHLSRKARR